MKKLALIQLFVLVLISSVFSQDEGFSNYRLSILSVNPAETGRIVDRAEFSVLYRDQFNNFTKGFRSFYTGFEYKLFCPDESFFAAGFNAAYGQAGSSKFSRISGGLSLSYHRKTASNILIAGGFELGGIQYRLQENNLQFDVQFDGIGFNPSFSNQEDFVGTSDLNLDLALGLVFYDQNGRWSLGAAVHHLFTPTVRLLNNEGFIIPLSLSVHGNVNIPKPSINFHGMYRNYGFVGNSQHFFILGFGPIFSFDRQSTLNLDFSFRLANNQEGNMINDAVIITAGLNQNGWQFGATADITTSPLLSATNSIGGLELFAIVPLKKDSNCVKCPRVMNPTN
ncbi:MAG: type IX secretion system membrane protein PorP/SprF [Bacteroidota bacterium]